MIVAAKFTPDRHARTDAAKFETLLPRIQQHAKRAFRRCPCEEREEAVAEVVAHAWIAFSRLMDRGLEHVIYATPLARYAIKRVRAHRCVGCVRNVNDISSTYAQRQHGIHVDRLDQYDDRAGQWKQLLVEDRRAGPADTAAVRIDFADWLQQLPKRLRRITELLAAGETTGAVARKFRLSSGRISQMRRELRWDWDDFQSGAAAV